MASAFDLHKEYTRLNRVMGVVAKLVANGNSPHLKDNHLCVAATKAMAVTLGFEIAAVYLSQGGELERVCLTSLLATEERFGKQLDKVVAARQTCMHSLLKTNTEALGEIILVPLLQDNILIGILVATFRSTEPLEDRELAHQVETIAKILSSLILNNRLFRECERQVEERTRDLVVAKEKAEASDRVKTRFLTNVSHEIRTPLNGIVGMAQLLLSTECDNQQSEYVAVINKSCATLIGQIESMLDFSNLSSGKVVLVDDDFCIKDLLTDITTSHQLSARDKQLKLSLQIDPHTPDWIRGDAIRLRQLVDTLVTNAIRYTTKGSVKVSLEDINDQGDRVGFKLVVQDTGIGLTDEQRHIVFDQFTQIDDSSTRSVGGVGLGLAIARQIVALMQGRLYATSQPGRGSTFTAEFSFKQALHLPGASGQKEVRTFTNY